MCTLQTQAQLKKLFIDNKIWKTDNLILANTHCMDVKRKLKYQT